MHSKPTFYKIHTCIQTCLHTHPHRLHKKRQSTYAQAVSISNYECVYRNMFLDKSWQITPFEVQLRCLRKTVATTETETEEDADRQTDRHTDRGGSKAN